MEGSVVLESSGVLYELARNSLKVVELLMNHPHERLAVREQDVEGACADAPCLALRNPCNGCRLFEACIVIKKGVHEVFDARLRCRHARDLDGRRIDGVQYSRNDVGPIGVSRTLRTRRVIHAGDGMLHKCVDESGLTILGQVADMHEHLHYS